MATPAPAPASAASEAPHATRTVSDAAWRKCLHMVDYAKKNSPRIAVLLRKIEARGCSLAAEPVVCENMFEGLPVAGAYDAARRVVVMNPAVPDKYLNQSEWTRGITHELIHAYDTCRAVVDPADCRHIACTEVRAANLSGDCDFGVELSRRPLSMTMEGWAGAQQQCVQRRAALSLQIHEQCVAQDVGATVASVWTPCYADVEPFSSN